MTAAACRGGQNVFKLRAQTTCRQRVSVQPALPLPHRRIVSQPCAHCTRFARTVPCLARFGAGAACQAEQAMHALGVWLATVARTDDGCDTQHPLRTALLLRLLRGARMCLDWCSARPHLFVDSGQLDEESTGRGVTDDDHPHSGLCGGGFGPLPWHILARVMWHSVSWASALSRLNCSDPTISDAHMRVVVRMLLSLSVAMPAMGQPPARPPVAHSGWVPVHAPLLCVWHQLLRHGAIGWLHGDRPGGALELAVDSLAVMPSLRTWGRQVRADATSHERARSAELPDGVTQLVCNTLRALAVSVGFRGSPAVDPLPQRQWATVKWLVDKVLRGAPGGQEVLATWGAAEQVRSPTRLLRMLVPGFMCLTPTYPSVSLCCAYP